MGAQPDRTNAAGDLRSAISDVTVRVLAEYTGRGPTRARTTMSGDWVFVTLEDTLTKGERKLSEIGRGDFVLEARKEFQNAMRDDLSREVEKLTGRKVIAFLSDNHLEPDIGLEAMMLAPAPGTPST
jgi:uncharacterized protein YbcI